MHDRVYSGFAVDGLLLEVTVSRQTSLRQVELFTPHGRSTQAGLYQAVHIFIQQVSFSDIAVARSDAAIVEIRCSVKKLAIPSNVSLTIPLCVVSCNSLFDVIVNPFLAFLAFDHLLRWRIMHQEYGTSQSGHSQVSHLL